ncbi:unnamed protein product [Calypogeia fissa]
MAMAVGAQRALQSVASFPSCAQVGSDSSASSSSCLTVRPSTLSSSSLRSAWTAQEFSGGIVKRSSSWERQQLGGRRGSLLGCRASFGGSTGALTPELKSALDNFVQSNKVVLFMKGNRDFPQCGFSNTCIQILNQCNVPYETVNILEDESLRQGVKEYSRWPTYPQLYIDGEFYGGCDITTEAYQSGDLKEALDKAIVS